MFLGPSHLLPELYPTFVLLFWLRTGSDVALIRVGLKMDVAKSNMSHDMKSLTIGHYYRGCSGGY